MEGLLIAEALGRFTPLLPSTRLSWRFPDAYTFVLPLSSGALWLYNRPPNAQIAWRQEVPSFGKTHSGFQDLLVARAAGELLRAEQVKLDRVVRLDFAAFEGFVAQPAVTLVAELTGRNCNLILLDEAGVVLGAAREVTPSINRFRQVRAGLRYEPPPPYEKLDPRGLTESALAEKLEGQKLADLRSIFDGVGPELSAAVAQLSGATRKQVLDDASALRAAAVLARIVAAPSAVLNSLGGGVDLAALREQEAQEQRVQRLRGGIERRRTLAYKKLEDISKILAAALDAETLREEADLLMAYAGDVPARTPQVSLTGFDGAPRVIALDPRHSARENAQQRYLKAKKREARLEDAAEREAGLKTEIAELNTLLARLPALPQSDLNKLSAIYAPDGKRSLRAAPGTRYLSPQGFEVWVGRTALGNEALTFKVAKSRDLWLHAQGYPGSHVIIKADNREIPFETVLFAAQLAAGYSKANMSDNVPVDYTLRKNVWKIKGAPPGAVNFSQQKTVYVTPTRRPGEGEPETKLG